jgi:hypothetical protein
MIDRVVTLLNSGILVADRNVTLLNSGILFAGHSFYSLGIPK